MVRKCWSRWNLSVVDLGKPSKEIVDTTSLVILLTTVVQSQSQNSWLECRCRGINLSTDRSPQSR